MIKPNIFQISTKELSQDGFFTWLLQWANEIYSNYDKELNETAKNFVRMLIEENLDYSIKTVRTKRQENKIDIIVEINDEYLVVIEDKVNTGEHSNQLDRYKQSIENSKEYQYKNLKLKFIYLKTGNENLYTLERIEQKKWKVINREDVLSVLNNCKTQNDIFNDFKEHLNRIEQETKSFEEKFENVKTKWFACEGFYLELQKRLGNKSADWHYIPLGNFLGFWYYWQGCGDYNLYIQIENQLKDNEFIGIKLKIKVDSNIRFIEKNDFLKLNLDIEIIWSELIKNGLINSDGIKLSNENKNSILENFTEEQSYKIIEILKKSSKSKKLKEINVDLHSIFSILKDIA